MILKEPKVALTQQAGWPWLAYPSRLTLRILCRPGLYKSADFDNRPDIPETESGLFIASFSYAIKNTPRVLYIEDHEDTRELVTLVLEQKSI